MKKIIHTSTRGFTLIEVLITIGIFIILTSIVMSTFFLYRKNQSLSLDTQTVATILRQARSQTLSYKNSSVYGVHFNTTDVVLFAGSSYDPSSPTNESYLLNYSDTIVTVTLTGGGSDVIFQRLTGETSQDGSIVISAPGLSQTKTVTIYKTGLVESQ
jgi:prepilin-type N-terminal cleavage/methylation domain-containing protein